MYIKNNKDFIITRVDENLVFYSMESENVIILDEISEEIWNLLDDAVSVNEISSKLIEVYDVDKDTLTKDIESTISSFLEKKLINEN